MKSFKARWEITENWQLIHPFLGLIATFFCGYLIAKRVLHTYLEGAEVSSTLMLALGTLLCSALILGICLWLFKKLYHRWKVSYRWELIAMFLVFAVTGSTAGRLSDPLMSWIGLHQESLSPWVYWPVRILLIFPIYQVLLVFFGWIFGQYSFFKAFAYKMASRMGLGPLFSKLP